MHTNKPTQRDKQTHKLSCILIPLYKVSNPQTNKEINRHSYAVRCEVKGGDGGEREKKLEQKSKGSEHQIIKEKHV